MRNHTVCLFTGILLATALLFAANVTAQQVSTKQPAESEVEKIELAINDLRSPNFGVRTAAVIQLRAMGLDAKDALGRAAADHSDADVRARAGKIYHDLQHGISPETPISIVKAIQAIRFGSASNQLGGVRFLISNERFDLLLSAVRLRQETNSRTQLAGLLLQNADGQKHFLQTGNLTELFDALAGDGPALSTSDQVELFSPELITNIVIGNQLGALIEFFESIPDPARFTALCRVIENPTAIESLSWSNDASELLNVIGLGATPEAKQELVSRAFANPVLMSKLLRTGAILQLLDLFDNDDLRLTGLFSSSKELLIVANSADAKQIIQLLNRFGSNEKRNTAARLTYSAISKRSANEPEKYSVLKEYFLELSDPWFQLRMTVDELQIALATTPTNKDAIQAAFDAVVSTNTKLEAGEVIQLLRQSAIIELVTTADGLQWLCKELSQLSVEDRFSALQRLYRHSSFINALAVDDGSRFFIFLDAILNVEDTRFQAIAISLVSQVRIDPRNPREWLYAGLSKRLASSSVPLVRQRIMVCIVNH